MNSIIKTELEKNSRDQKEVTINAGNNIIQKINRELHKHLKDDVKFMITYQGTKLSSRFQVKSQTKFEHRNDVVYCCECPENDCDDFFTGETDQRI